MRRIVAVIALGAAAVGCSTVDPSPKLKAATVRHRGREGRRRRELPRVEGPARQGREVPRQRAEPDQEGRHSEGAIKQLNLASAAADDAKVTATDASNVAKIQTLSQQIADLKMKLGK